MRYTKLYFADENWDLFHEIGSDGYAERYVIVDLTIGYAINAASFAEWKALDTTGRARYEAKFGRLPTTRVESKGVTIPPPSYEEEISESDFEDTWSVARAQLEERWAEYGERLYEIESSDE